jgi:hypothetical protein
VYDPQHLATLEMSTSCYRNSLTFYVTFTSFLFLFSVDGLNFPAYWRAVYPFIAYEVKLQNSSGKSDGRMGNEMILA